MLLQSLRSWQPGVLKHLQVLEHRLRYPWMDRSYRHFLVCDSLPG